MQRVLPPESRVWFQATLDNCCMRRRFSGGPVGRRQVMQMVAAISQCPALAPPIKSKPFAFAFRQMVNVFLKAVEKTTLMQDSSNAMHCIYWSRCSENGVPAPRN
ncbi:uncharacterized protein LOC142568127 isoform X1 [Dermacentor variabilis]|uniref:uncharacterized protein LOC142568127 isoform X1 n=2 Tax=Dermacentor variabilis TaxID=34621 RepID=UPI003F5B0925